MKSTAKGIVNPSCRRPDVSRKVLSWILEALIEISMESDAFTQSRPIFSNMQINYFSGRNV